MGSYLVSFALKSKYKSYRSIMVEKNFGIPWILGGRAPMETECIHIILIQSTI